MSRKRRLPDSGSPAVCGVMANSPGSLVRKAAGSHVVVPLRRYSARIASEPSRGTVYSGSRVTFGRGMVSAES